MGIKIISREVIVPEDFPVKDVLNPLADMTFDFWIEQLKSQYPELHSELMMKLAFRLVQRIKNYKRDNNLNSIKEHTNKILASGKRMRHPYEWKNQGIEAYLHHPEESNEYERLIKNEAEFETENNVLSEVQRQS
jgi:hypothetical protein